MSFAIDGSLWARMHGGVTHFPIALMIASMLFDLIAVAIRREPFTKELHNAGFYALLLAALGSLAAVATGLLLSGGDMLGSGMLGKHHYFLWPGFLLLIVLSVWRLRVREGGSRKNFALYLVGAIVAAGLVSGAGYWGGEMLMTLMMRS